MTEKLQWWCRGLGMPHLEVVCLFCGGIIRDLLLECVPQAKRGTVAYALLMDLNPGAAFPCPYCSALLGFDEHHNLRTPASGWPVLRYGQAELQLRRETDGEPPGSSLPDWGRKHHWLEPGTHSPLSEYNYAEQAAKDETVP
jgi:hypothetical protein